MFIFIAEIGPDDDNSGKPSGEALKDLCVVLSGEGVLGRHADTM
jgi:hypothetical protein